MPQDEIIFIVEDSEEGGLLARALDHAIFTEADDMDHLRRMARDAVTCHFADAATRPRLIRLHYVRDEVIAT